MVLVLLTALSLPLLASGCFAREKAGPIEAPTATSYVFEWTTSEAHKILSVRFALSLPSALNCSLEFGFGGPGGAGPLSWWFEETLRGKEWGYRTPQVGLRSHAAGVETGRANSGPWGFHEKTSGRSFQANEAWDFIVFGAGANELEELDGLSGLFRVQCPKHFSVNISQSQEAFAITPEAFSSGAGVFYEGQVGGRAVTIHAEASSQQVNFQGTANRLAFRISKFSQENGELRLADSSGNHAWRFADISNHLAYEGPSGSAEISISRIGFNSSNAGPSTWAGVYYGIGQPSPGSVVGHSP